MKDENNPPQPWIDPAIEARIVASVLGETSAFEAAEIERLVAANPELALFKRRIEATHGLLETATRPENPKIQLSPERRRKLLETIGVPAVAPPKKVHVIVPPSPWWTSALLIRAAACLIMTGLAVALLSSITVVASRRETADFEGGDGGFVSVQVPLSSTEPLSQIQPPALGDIPLAGRIFRESAQGAASPQLSAPSTTTAAPVPTAATIPSSGLVVFRKGGDGAVLSKSQSGEPADQTTQKLSKLSAFTGGVTAATANVDEAMELSSGIAPLPNLARAQEPVMREELKQLQEALPMEQPARGSEAFARAEMGFKSAENIDSDDSLRATAPLASEEAAKAPAPSQQMAASELRLAAPMEPATEDQQSSAVQLRQQSKSAAQKDALSKVEGLEQAGVSEGSGSAFRQQTGEAAEAIMEKAELAEAKAELVDAKPQQDWNSQYMYRGVDVLAGKDQPTDAPKLEAEKDHASTVGNILAPETIAALQKERKQLEWNAKMAAEGSMLTGAKNGVAPEEWQKQQLTKRDMEMQPTLARIAEIQAQLKANQPEEVAKSSADKAESMAAAEIAQDAELQTQLQEKETLIAKLRSEVEASKGLAGKQKKLTPMNEGAAASAPQKEISTQLQDQEAIIAELQSELEATRATATAATEVPLHSAVSANSIDSLVAGVPANSSSMEGASQPIMALAGVFTTPNVVNQPVFGDRNGRVEFDGFVNYGSPIQVEGTDEAKKARAKQLMEDGKKFQETGRFDLAQKRFEQSLEIERSNPEARKGLAETAAAKAKNATSAYNETRSTMLYTVDAGWALPVRRFDIGATTITAQPEIDQRGGGSAVTRKLDEIVIPRINFEDVTVQEALDFIKQRAASLDSNETDPAKKGVNIVLNLPPDAVESEAKITLGLRDIPLRAAINYVASAANLKLKVEPYAVSVVPMSTATEALVTKEYTVPPGFITALPQSSTPAKLGAGATAAAGSLPAIAARSGVREYLANSGVTFPPGATAYYIAATNKLIVKNTQANLDLVDALTAPAGISTEAAILGNETSVADERFSTFSLHVSDVSFQLAKDALARGAMPDPARIRPEEFYNAFDYNDPAPGASEQVACRIEQSAHPLLQQRDLVRIAVKVAAAGRASGQPLRLTILLDTSGSMEREDRAASVRRALQSLVNLLGPNDRITLIGFARTPRLLAEDVPGDQAGKLVEMADRTPSQGGTNLEEALALASELALKHRAPNGQNRIVLLTDGAANLGDANPERLARQIDKTRQQGISFDACGVGAKGLNDEILEALTRKGDGRYYFLNKPEDADQGFARQLAGAFRPAAENVKVQVVFNPARVASYRLIGFEKHLLEKQDFRNDKVQAAELSAEEAGVALYQVQPLPEGSGELGEVFVRFRDPATGKMVERSWTMPYDERTPSFDQASPSLQLAATSALLAERLAGNEQIDLNALAPVLNRLRARYGEQERVGQLLQMFERVRR